MSGKEDTGSYQANCLKAGLTAKQLSRRVSQIFDGSGEF
jgi:hypothetical protein